MNDEFDDRKRAGKGREIEDLLDGRLDDEPVGPSEPSEPSEASEPDATSESEPTSAPSGPSETSEVTNLKSEWSERTVYLEPALDEQIGQLFKRLDYQLSLVSDEDLEKNRHVYPVVWRDGVDAVAEMDIADLFDRLDDLELAHPKIEE